MGYTHYYNFKKNTNVDKERWNEAVKLGKACMDASGVEICGADGTGKPKINEDVICLNGKGEMSHETFYMPRKVFAFEFCKTARKPYDIVVCCFLLAFKKVFGKDFEYRSDGTTREDLRKKENKEYWAKNCPNWTPHVEEEWAAAYKLFNKVYKTLNSTASIK